MLLRVLPSINHYILADLGIYGITIIGQIKAGSTFIEHWKLTSLCIFHYRNYICQNSSAIIKKLKGSNLWCFWLHWRKEWCCQEKTYQSSGDSEKYRLWHIAKQIWCIFIQPGTILTYIHQAFWVNLAIHIGITLVQSPQIMPLFLCFRRDELCKNDPCLSLADVRLSIEQEFRALQVLGGNKWIAKSSECLEEYSYQQPKWVTLFQISVKSLE